MDARLGTLLRQSAGQLNSGNAAAALATCQAALALDRACADAHSNRGVALAMLGRGNEAVESLESAIALAPANAAAHVNLAVLLKDLDRRADAASVYQRLIAQRPDLIDAHNNLANLLLDLGRPEDALASYDRALALAPGFAHARHNRGITLKLLGRLDQAAASFAQCLALNPDHAPAHLELGRALSAIDPAADVIAHFDRAIAIAPDMIDAFIERAAALKRLGRLAEAVATYRDLLRRQPAVAMAHNNLGNVLKDLQRSDEALACYDRAIALDPDYADAINNRGCAQMDLGRWDSALVSFGQAIAMRPADAVFHANRGIVLGRLERRHEALEAYDRVIALDPRADYARGERLHLRMHLCDWAGFDEEVAAIVDGVGKGQRVANPFVLLAVLDSPAVQLECARIRAARIAPAPIPPDWSNPDGAPGRLKIGYFSSDFHDHATMHLLGEAIEAHDRDRFELFAFSYGSQTGGEWAQRMAAVSRFIDARTLSDREVAERARAIGIDIAVDLKGYTTGARMGIFAERAAPVQAGFLGYPGTSGAPFIDYLIADRHVIPDHAKTAYSEEVVYLPGSYQPNARLKPATIPPPRRADHGLPETGFVYCCFNQTYKITPATFAGWMRILRATTGSVLWLWADDERARANLRQAARDHDVAPERLCFADRKPLPDHLARLSLGELFLDTLPYNAHTSASDALRAGVPVLTCAGHSFVSRVASSLLRALDLPELVTDSMADYEALAIALGTDPSRIAQVRSRLADALPKSPLFDPVGFARNLEAAYAAMSRPSSSGTPGRP